MSRIYIFYAQISEQKSKNLRLHGPFIHYRHNKSNVIDDDDYIFNDEEYTTEKKFLIKYLRTKYPHRITLFHRINLPNCFEKIWQCDCGYSHPVGEDNTRCNAKCGQCGERLYVLDESEIKSRFRQRSLLDAKDYFDSKFEIMQDNYEICSRRK